MGGGGGGGFKLSSGDFFQNNSRKIIWTFGVSRKSLIWHVSQIWSRSLVPIPKYSSNHWVNWLDLCSSLLYLKLFITANGNVPIDKQLRSKTTWLSIYNAEKISAEVTRTKYDVFNYSSNFTGFGALRGLDFGGTPFKSVHYSKYVWTCFELMT